MKSSNYWQFGNVWIFDFSQTNTFGYFPNLFRDWDLCGLGVCHSYINTEQSCTIQYNRLGKTDWLIYWGMWLISFTIRPKNDIIKTKVFNYQLPINASKQHVYLCVIWEHVEQSIMVSWILVWRPQSASNRTFIFAIKLSDHNSPWMATAHTRANEWRTNNHLRPDFLQSTAANVFSNVILFTSHPTRHNNEVA